MPVTHEELTAKAEERRSYLGGSDMENLLGLEYGCQLRLFNQKTGVEADLPFFGNAATDRGNRLEAVAGEFYVEQTSRSIRRVPFKRHPDLTYIACHADYEIITNERGPGLLSIKTPGRYMFMKMRDSGGPAAGYLAQLQWELFIWERNWGSFGVYWPDGDKLLVWDTGRDEEIINGLLEAAQAFWGRVATGDAPNKLAATDKRCRACQYRLRCHSGELQAMLAAEGDERPEFLDIVPLVAEIKEAQQGFDEAEALLETAKEKMRVAMGGRQVADTAGYRIHFKALPGRELFAHRAFAVAHPEMREEIAKYLKRGEPYRTLRIFDKPTGGQENESK